MDSQQNNFSKDDALLAYRNAWQKNQVDEKFYADEIEFYAPMKVFKGKKDVIAALKNWFLMLNKVSDYSYIIKNNSACMISKIYLNNTGGEIYSFWEYDYFQFNNNNQIKLYRPIFDSGAPTHDLLGFDIASRCSEARKLADKS
jgi:hypothetical protein